MLILDKAEFDLSIRNNPYNPIEGKTAHFMFCSKTPKLNVAKIKKLASESEQFQLIGKIFYLYAPEGIGRSKLAANVESCLGVPATARNLNTINKLKQIVDTLTS